jgi:hypothetical protein
MANKSIQKTSKINAATDEDALPFYYNSPIAKTCAANAGRFPPVPVESNLSRGLRIYQGEQTGRKRISWEGFDIQLTGHLKITHHTFWRHIWDGNDAVVAFMSVELL